MPVSDTATTATGAADRPQLSFDAVLRGLGLTLLPDPARALAEFRRVLRTGGRVAVSVNTVPERLYNGRVSVIIARHVPLPYQTDIARIGLNERSTPSPSKRNVTPVPR
jgi:SAM-dependent methyltransferase